jgi:signal transduction histidine kinase
VPFGEWLSKMQELIGQWQQTGKASWIFLTDVSLFTSDHELSPEVAINLFRITQEALSNAYKHSSATIIEVEVRLNAGILHLCIADNGQGVVETGKTGYGLQNMAARAKDIGATYTLRSENGTRIIIEKQIS